jgi:8-oxo-dGTP pyrophosphatase MutT (NUDIX family)
VQETGYLGAAKFNSEILFRDRYRAGARRPSFSFGLTRERRKMDPLAKARRSSLKDKAKELVWPIASGLVTWLVGWYAGEQFPALKGKPLPWDVVVAAAVIAVTGVAGWLHRRSPRNSTNWDLTWQDLFALYRADWDSVKSLEHDSSEEFIPQMFLADLSGSEELKLRIVVEEGSYKIGPDIRDLVFNDGDRLKNYLKSWARAAIYKHEVDEKSKFSVRGFERNGNEVILKLQSLDYDDVLATHYQMDFHRKHSQSIREFLLEKDPRHSIGGWVEKGLFLPNILGINILIFTPSGRLLLQKRSSHVAVRPGEICASGSGSVNREDVISDRLANVIREAHEELALDPGKIRAGSIRFLGLTRDLVSHGVVDCHFCAITEEATADILRKRKQAEDKKEISDVLVFEFGAALVEGSLDTAGKVRFARKFQELIDEHWENLSLPLKSGLKLWSIDRLR